MPLLSFLHQKRKENKIADVCVQAKNWLLIFSFGTPRVLGVKRNWGHACIHESGTLSGFLSKFLKSIPHHLFFWSPPPSAIADSVSTCPVQYYFKVDDLTQDSLPSLFSCLYWMDRISISNSRSVLGGIFHAGKPPAP